MICSHGMLFIAYIQVEFMDFPQGIFKGPYNVIGMIDRIEGVETVVIKSSRKAEMCFT